MILRYQSGEEIKKGDHVRYHREPGRTELVAVDINDSEQSWYVQEYGGGVMVREPVSGRTFIPANQLPDCEDLEFVSRATPDDDVQS